MKFSHRIFVAAPAERRGVRLVLHKGMQMGLFGGGRPAPRAPEPPPKAAGAEPVATPAPKPPPPKPAATEHPPGAGWIAIPNSRHGGFHRQKPGGGFEYWYPGEGVRQSPKDLGDFELRPQSAGGARDNSGRTQHHDVGEKVKGAKKERWEQVHSGNLEALEAGGDALASKHVTKEAVLGETSAETDQALGSTAGAAYLKREIRRMISAKPTVAGMDPKKARSAYVEGVEWLREALDGAKTVEDIDHLRDEAKWLADGGGAYDEEIPVTVESARSFAERFKRTGFGSTTFLYPRGPDGKAIMVPNAHGGTEKLHFEVNSDTLRMAGYKVFNSSRSGQTTIRKLQARQKPYGAWFASMGPRMATLFGGAGYSESTLKTWHQHTGNARKRQKENDWKDLLSAETAEAEGGERTRLDVHREIGVRRRGKLERIGGTPTPKRLDGSTLAQDFGLRAVQYGNWIDDESASKHLDACHGALSDLADVIGADPKMLAHGSKLAIAFGARGGGSANAHYETGEQIINLTATRGGGTLAHEWAHFIDHMLPDELFYSDTPWSQNASWGSHGRSGRLSPEAVNAYRGVMHALHYGDGSHSPTAADPVALERERGELTSLKKEVDTAMKAARAGAGDSSAAHKALQTYNARVRAFNDKARAVRGSAGRRPRSKFLSDATTLGDYWERPHEMFARAFESYVEDRLEDGKRRNTYLVSGTRDPMNLTKTVKGEVIGGLEPYPQGGERKAIADAFDTFFAVMRTSGALRKALRGSPLRAVPAGARVHGADGSIAVVR